MNNNSIDESKNFNDYINVNSNFFNLTIFIEDDKLNFNCSHYSTKQFYKQSYSFDELQSINELFSIYNNINEIYDVIIDIYKNNKKIEKDFPKIEVNEKEKKFDLILLGKNHSITIPLASKIEREKIKINAQKNLEEDVKKLDDLTKLIEKYKKENSELKIEIKNLKAQIEMNKKNEASNGEIKNQQLSVTNSNFHIEEFISKNKMDILKKWIKNSSTYFKNKTFHFSLIYKATVHGDSAQNFHKNVDGKGPLLIIVKTTENKIIGGYTSKPWSSSNDRQKDDEAFLFTFESYKMYKIKQSSYACFHLTKEGPVFGNSYELFISDECLNNQKSFVNGESKCFKIYDKKNLLNNPQKTYFKVLDYEVHQIKFQ
jgi:cell division septum initiation protein DivIVA